MVSKRMGFLEAKPEAKVAKKKAVGLPETKVAKASEKKVDESSAK